MLVLGTIITAPVVGFAAEDENYLDLNLEELLKVEVKGATLRAESLQTAPSSVTVFTREQIEALGLDYLHELLNLAPGFQMVRTSDNGVNYTYSLRGRRLGGRARELLLMVDGRVFDDPRSGGADSAFYMYPLANIEKVEIISGPGSSIYGSGAFTGVINVVSRKRENNLAIALGNLASKSLDVQLTRQQQDVQADFYFHAKQDDGETYQLLDQAFGDPRKELFADFQLQLNDTQVQAAWGKTEAPEFITLDKVDGDFNRFEQEFRQLRLSQAMSVSENWSLNAALGYTYASQDFHAQLVPLSVVTNISEPKGGEPMRAKVNLLGEAYFATLANDISLGANDSLQWGGEWRDQRETKAHAYSNYDMLQLSQGDYPINYYGDFSHKFPVSELPQRQVSSGYLQWLHKFNQDLRLVAGGRYDHYQNLGERLSPRLGFVYQFNQQHNFKLMYGEAFRAPSFAETSLLNNPVVFGNPNLDNEVVKTLEFTWLGNWRALSTEFALYRNHYVSPIVLGDKQGVRSYVNGEDDTSLGATLSFVWQVSDAWLLRYSHGDLDSLPEGAFREATNLNSWILNYQQGKWNWSLSGVHQGPRQYRLAADQLDSLDGYTLFNSQLRYQLNSATSLSLAAKNLLDENYSTPPQGVGIVGGVPNRGRELRLKLDWAF